MGIPTDLLTATCDVHRRQRTGTAGKLGHDTGEFTYALLTAGVACRRESRIVKTRDDQREGVVNVEYVYFGPGVDVRNTDRLVFGSETIEVETVKDRPGGVADHHVEVTGRVVE